MRTIRKSITLGACCLALALPAHAGEQIVFTWVDADGVTHFSETPPQDTAIETYQIKLEPPPAAGPVQNADHYSVINQVQRMQQSRLESEKVKTERLQAEAEAKRAAAASQPYVSSGDDDSDRYYPVYPAYPYYYGYRPGYRPGYKPGHRPGRPVQRPEPGRGPGRTSPGAGLSLN